MTCDYATITRFGTSHQPEISTRLMLLNARFLVSCFQDSSPDDFIKVSPSRNTTKICLYCCDLLT
jgi:hypothetical protein